ncbi:hypothetical protein M1K46_03495 [Fictibacillus sp. WQ 8-8]|uniref:hypothetical protein n=1 Tax=Fictibacillus sp. WQ 8-8 TaxID=2938788 RepID=UPI00210DD3C5|nr:hypothetical protein [Fictibacillus sp. WQ 8-8]MCQ6264730.1 hypothetical protein [Fictibacillus sp. WQ 8-8]
MKKPSILIISYYFAPKNEVAAIRLTKLAKFLVRNGWKVSVLTFEGNPFNSYENKKDETLLSPELEEIEIEYVNLPKLWLKVISMKTMLKARKINRNSSEETLESPKGTKSGGSIKKKSAIKKQLFYMAYYAYDVFFNYLLTQGARKHIDKLIYNNNPDVIFSSFGPISSVNIGKYAKKQSKSSHWLLDLRDSIIRLSDYEVPPIYGIKKRFERKNLIKADSVSVVSKGMKEGILDRHKDLKNEMIGKVQIFTNGYDLEDLNLVNDREKIIEKDNNLHICYVGRLYPDRSRVQMLAEAIQELTQERSIDLDRIKIHYAGSSFSIFKSQLVEYGISDILINHGVISRSQSLQLQKECHLLLMLTWNDKHDKGIITGKLLEYMMTKRPILALVSGDVKNSEAKSIIESCRIGMAFEEATYHDDIKSLKKFIVDSFNQVSTKGDILYNPNEEELEAFNYEKITDRLTEHLINKKLM